MKKMFNLFKKIFKNIPKVDNAKIIDSVFCGKKDSELKHQGFGAWSERTPHKSSCYQGESNYIHNDGKVSARNYAGETGVKLLNKLSGESSQDLLINLMVYDTPYEVGALTQVNKATTVYISADNDEWLKIGSYILTYEGKIASFIFKIPQFIGKEIYVKLDNHVNIIDEENHYGQSVHFIGLYKNES